MPEDRDIVLKATSPDYIKEKLSDSKTFYINYRIINDKHAQYLQLRIVNVGDGDSISQIVLGYRSVDEEILREMQQKQILEEALNKATMANIAQNTFLSNMSHDMRTPLNAIFGYTALARKYLDDLSSLEGYLDKIDASSEQLLDLIDKVLELSWMESKDMSISESECNLESIVQEVYGTVS
ncbi:non-motile and phage-resistance protein [Clostridiales bacterium]|nr:non-motile and phage-resistance protein [Clostridiales bacterium]